MQGDGNRYDPETALVVVDVQNDFADPAGSLYVRDGHHVVPVANEQVSEATSAGAYVVYSQDWHPGSTPHFADQGGLWPVHCVKGSWGAAFHPDLRVVGDVVHKGDQGGDGYSAFSERDPLSGETEPTTLRRLLTRARRRAARDLRPGHRFLRGGDGRRRTRARLPGRGRSRRDPRGGSDSRGRRPRDPTHAGGRSRAHLIRVVAFRR